MNNLEMAIGAIVNILWLIVEKSLSKNGFYFKESFDEHGGTEPARLLVCDRRYGYCLTGALDSCRFQGTIRAWTAHTYRSFSCSTGEKASIQGIH
jgi:hypothetical protein